MVESDPTSLLGESWPQMPPFYALMQAKNVNREEQMVKLEPG